MTASRISPCADNGIIVSWHPQMPVSELAHLRMRNNIGDIVNKYVIYSYNIAHDQGFVEFTILAPTSPSPLSPYRYHPCHIMIVHPTGQPPVKIHFAEPGRL